MWGLEIRLDDDHVDRAVSQLIAGVMGDLARVEHKQKLRRITSGIKAAQQAGKWTGRPLRGFRIDDTHHLRVNVEEFLQVRSALERVVDGESLRSIADTTGISESTLRRLYTDEQRRMMYLAGETDDSRIDTALEDVRPLPDLESTARRTSPSIFVRSSRRKSPSDEGRHWWRKTDVCRPAAGGLVAQSGPWVIGLRCRRPVAQL